MAHEIERSDALWIALAVSRSKLLHQAINLLRFARKSEAAEEGADGGDERKLTELEAIDVSVHHFAVESAQNKTKMYQFIFANVLSVALKITNCAFSPMKSPTAV